MNFNITFYLHVKEANYWFSWLNTLEITGKVTLQFVSHVYLTV